MYVFEHYNTSFQFVVVINIGSTNAQSHMLPANVHVSSALSE